MQVSVKTEGSLKIIRLPSALLKQCEIEDSVELEVKDKTIIIRPVRTVPRRDWGKAFQEMHKRGDDNLLVDDGFDPNVKDVLREMLVD